MLANGDLLRIEAVTEGGLLVRRALDADPRTGRRRWTDRQFLYAHCEEAELGYAVTDHVAQGRTVHTGLAVITGAEDRQHAYVALTRGTHDNTAYVFTQSPERADPATQSSTPTATPSSTTPTPTPSSTPTPTPSSTPTATPATATPTATSPTTPPASSSAPATP
jgi:hypothetical protein